MPKLDGVVMSWRDAFYMIAGSQKATLVQLADYKKKLGEARFIISKQVLIAEKQKIDKIASPAKSEPMLPRCGIPAPENVVLDDVDCPPLTLAEEDVFGDIQESFDAESK